jgi:hypothetical protein
MNIDHPSIQGLIRAATCALYARAFKDSADAAGKLDGIGILINGIAHSMQVDLIAPLNKAAEK